MLGAAGARPWRIIQAVLDRLRLVEHHSPLVPERLSMSRVAVAYVVMTRSVSRAFGQRAAVQGSCPWWGPAAGSELRPPAARCPPPHRHNSRVGPASALGPVRRSRPAVDCLAEPMSPRHAPAPATTEIPARTNRAAGTAQLGVEPVRGRRGSVTAEEPSSRSPSQPSARTPVTGSGSQVVRGLPPARSAGGLRHAPRASRTPGRPLQLLVDRHHRPRS
jgi:hypothetical protein